MKKLSSVGLVVEGKSTNSAILRLPNLAEELGPIKATPLRVARRLANFLRAGYGVSTYEELAQCRLILIRAPDNMVRRIVDELCRADLDFSDAAVVLCETWQSGRFSNRFTRSAPRSELCSPFRAIAGAGSFSKRSLGPLGLAKQFIDGNEGKVFELKPGSKQLYFAAELLATAFPIPLLMAAQQALRDAGIGGNILHSLLEELAQKMFKDFLNASRTTWGGPLSACSPDIAEEYFRNLRCSDPNLANLLDEQLALSRQSLSSKIKTDLIVCHTLINNAEALPLEVEGTRNPSG